MNKGSLAVAGGKPEGGMSTVATKTINQLEILPTG